MSSVASGTPKRSATSRALFKVRLATTADLRLGSAHQPAQVVVGDEARPNQGDAELGHADLKVKRSKKLQRALAHLALASVDAAIHDAGIDDYGPARPFCDQGAVGLALSPPQCPGGAPHGHPAVERTAAGDVLGVQAECGRTKFANTPWI